MSNVQDFVLFNMLCTVAKCPKRDKKELVVKVFGRPCFITLKDVVLLDTDWVDVLIGNTFEVGNLTHFNLSTSSFHECELRRTDKHGDFVFESLEKDTTPKLRPKWQKMFD